MQNALSVSQITQLIKNQLESQFRGLLVQGEISNCKPHSAGHLYFDLKDSGARISCVMFRTENSALSRAPKDGDQVCIKGALTIYPPHGKYQMVIKELTYAGVGVLLLKLHELKIKLESKGWFSPNHKKPIPKFPKTIGVVTSPTGAVIRDIINVLARRHSGFHLILNPVKVQGAESALEIAQAIEQFNQYHLADVLIVGRGGGSLEDLWSFNEEVVAEAIYKSRIPIISAVGHETDVCIADFVADVRAPTPSAAAEIAISEKMQHIHFLLKTKQQLLQIVTHKHLRYRDQLFAYLKQPALSSPTHLIGKFIQQLDDYEEQIESSIKQKITQKKLYLSNCKIQLATLNPQARLISYKQKLIQINKSLNQSFLYKLKLYRAKLENYYSTLESLNPKKVLERGYSILFAENEKSVIVSANELSENQEIFALLSDGKVSLTVNKVIK